MWLLDVNVPAGVQTFLLEREIPCERADRKGWTQLKNSDLVKAAFQEGFQCLLTRDQLFGESALRVLKQHPLFAVVLLTLRQAREQDHLSSFNLEWERNPTSPIPGQMIYWPERTPGKNEPSN